MTNPKQNDNTPQTFPCTDLGNMERFIDQHKDCIRSTSSGAVFEWTGNRWKPVSYADIFNLARKTVLKIQSEARHAAAEAEANDLRRWSLTSQTEAKIRSMINMACKHEDIQVKLGDFDKDRNRINCLNGIIDLTNGQLLGRASKDYVSKIINVDYDPYAKAPLFETLIGQIFGHDKELIDWVQRALGYSLTGSTSEQVLFAALGTGAVAYHKALAASGSTGLGPCKAIDEQVDQYRYDNDLPTRFLDECTREQKGSKVPARELYDHYCDWCQLNGDNDTISQQIFSKRMQERGLLKTRSNAGVFYKDVVTVKNNPF